MKRIVACPEVLSDKPVVKGIHIPIYLILELLAAKMDMVRVLREYPKPAWGYVQAVLERLNGQAA